MNYKRYFLWFFIAYTLIGFATMPQFGVPLDELTQRFIGIENNRFIAGQASAADVEANKYYGPVFESISYVFEQIIYSQPLRVKLYMRHCLMFGLFLLALYCFHFIAKRLFKNEATAVLCSTFFALYPPLFAHAHYNSKDTLFLVLVVFSLYYFVKYAEQPKIKWLIGMSVIIGIASTVRFTGVFVGMALGTGLLMLQPFILKSKLKEIAIVFCAGLIAYYAVFPLFWVHPIEGWAVLLKYITNNPWPWDELVAGIWVKQGHQPWWYLPVWLGVSLPSLLIFLFAFGTFQFIKNKSFKNPLPITIALLFALPFFYTICLQPTLYDGWRHLQYIIVPIVLMAGFGMDSILNGRKQLLKFAVITTYALGLFLNVWSYPYLYFNEVYRLLVPPNTFTQDYWALSSKPCLEWIAANDSENNILISSNTNAPELQAIWLGYSETNKFKFTDHPNKGKYEIQVKRDGPFQHRNGKVVYRICVGKDTISRVIRYTR
jgi:hypothetical protein